MNIINPYLQSLELSEIETYDKSRVEQHNIILKKYQIQCTDSIKKVLSNWSNKTPKSEEFAETGEYERSILAQKYSSFFEEILVQNKN